MTYILIGPDSNHAGQKGIVGYYSPRKRGILHQRLCYLWGKNAMESIYLDKMNMILLEMVRA